MDVPSSPVRAWTAQLLAAEAAADPPTSQSHMAAAVRVADKLRVSLTRFVGQDGFTALQRRAVALARADVPSLRTVKVTAEGRLEGIEEVDNSGEAASAITSRLLGLFVTFIGEQLTLSLLREAFPDAVREITGEKPEDLQ
jgi:hypothetical protein